MSELVTLSYRRVPGDLSSGVVILSSEEDVNYVEILESFEGIDFVPLMKVFAKHLVLHPLAAGVFQRTDRAGLAPIRMGDEEAELFRKDLATAIQNRTFSARTINVGVGKKEEAINMVQPLTTGYEMRADFFGEVVFVRMKDGKLECPECGKWAHGVLEKDPNFYFCNDCGLLTHVEEKSSDWAGIKVQGLTDSTIERLFLPRKWNKNGNWISRVELQQMLEAYLEEKAKVTCTR
jgi:hypothetical protein